MGVFYKGKYITELIASRGEKLASVPFGGGSAAAFAAPGGGATAPIAVEPKERGKAHPPDPVF